MSLESQLNPLFINYGFIIIKYKQFYMSEPASSESYVPMHFYKNTQENPAGARLSKPRDEMLDQLRAITPDDPSGSQAL